MKANILLEGPTGTGKTFAIRTLLPHFRRVCVLSHEQGFWNTIRSKPIDEKLLKRIKLAFVPPAKLSWSILIDNAKKINLSSNENLQKMPGINKQDYTQWIQMLSMLADFRAEDGDKLGAADDWGEDTCLVDDGLSGLGTMSIDLNCGAKPIKTQPDWGVGMDNLHNFLRMMTTGLKCSYIQLAHVEKEPNPLTGMNQITVSTLGSKLAPKIPHLYDEVILTKRVGKTFLWSTADPQVDLKTRLLPLEENLQPDFGLIFKEVIPDASTEVHEEGQKQA